MLVPSLMLALLGAEPDPVTAQLERGEIIVRATEVEGSKVPLASVEAVIDVAPERVWAIISDCGSYQKTLPRIAKSELLKREANTVTCRVTADMPFPLADLTSVTRGVETVVPGQRWSRAWTLVEGDYVSHTGGWELSAWKGDKTRTHLRYRIQAEPKIAVPQALINAAQKSALPDLVEHVRAAAKQQKAP